MDIKRLLPAILIAVVLMFLVPRLFNGGGGATAPKSANPIYTEAASRPVIETEIKQQTVTLGSAEKNSKDKLTLTINTETAGVDRVQLNVNDYAQTVERKEPLTLFEAPPGLPRPFSTLAIRVQRVGVDTVFQLFDERYVWGVAQPNPYEARLTLLLRKDGKPLAEVVKTFKIDPNSYEVTISHSVTNQSEQPLKVEIDQLGPSELPRDDARMDDRFFHAAGLDTAKKKIDSARFNATQAELAKFVGGTKPIGQFNDYTKNPGLWIASSNRFFAAIVRPLPMSPATTTFPLVDGRTIPQVSHIASANVDVMHWDTDPAKNVGVVRLNGAVVDVAPATTVTESLSAFMGPKKREILDGNSKAALGTAEYTFSVYEYISIIQLTQGGCYSFCTLDFVVRPILWLLNVLTHSVAFGNYGIAIMVLVIVVRAAMHPLTRASQINMAVMGKKMKDVQPQVEAAKKKYATNKTKQNEEMMRIYRENKVNPAGGILGCLPMLIQMPIWAALYSGLSSDIDLRQASFIPGWINDLSHPDTIFPTSLPVQGHPLFTLPLLGDIYGLNLLPLLLTVVFFIQMKVATASQPKPADEQQAQMQKMSQYMIFIFPVFLYNAPSGLNLYIFASTMGGLVDTWLVRKTLKKRGILPATAQTLPTHEQKPA